MIYLIGGGARCGKSTLAKSFLKRLSTKPSGAQQGALAGLMRITPKKRAA